MREEGIGLQLGGFAELCPQCRLNSEADLGTLGRLHVDPLMTATLSWGVWFGLSWEPAFYLAGSSGHGSHEVWLNLFQGYCFGGRG